MLGSKRRRVLRCEREMALPNDGFRSASRQWADMRTTPSPSGTSTSAKSADHPDHHPPQPPAGGAPSTLTSTATIEREDGRRTGPPTCRTPPMASQPALMAHLPCQARSSARPRVSASTARKSRMRGCVPAGRASLYSRTDNASVWSGNT
ncbi:hypothetical protein GCM10023235_05730 [Kitasatospora terrestris]|uniref:Uncharacterized protein n=1 Tax=Kitasatospora terrestris TaxID=258051 RepID=A0ABP9D7Z6_9ACTN